MMKVLVLIGFFASMVASASAQVLVLESPNADNTPLSSAMLSSDSISMKPRFVNAELMSSNDTAVMVRWQSPISTSIGKLLGYNIYRNGVQLNTALIPFVVHCYVDTDIDYGSNYEYLVEACYDDGDPTTSDVVALDVVCSSLVEAMPMVRVFPNPTRGELVVESTSKIQAMSIYNFQGQLMKEWLGGGARQQMHLDLPNGIYFVHIKTKERTYLEKIMIEK